MMCLLFSVAVVCLTLAALCLMVGWRRGASQLARIAVAIVIGSAIVSWLVDAVRSFVSRPQVAIVAGSLALVLVVAVAAFALGWFFKRRTVGTAAVRPTLRRRVLLTELGEYHAETTSAEPQSGSPDDLQLFGGGSP